MRSKRQQQQSTRRIRRERRRLGRFVFFLRSRPISLRSRCSTNVRRQPAGPRLTKRNRAGSKTTEMLRQCPAGHDYPAAAQLRYTGDQFSDMEAGRPDAPPLLLLHGIGANSLHWRYPTDRFRVIAWNAPGYMLSDLSSR